MNLNNYEIQRLMLISDYDVEFISCSECNKRITALKKSSVDETFSFCDVLIKMKYCRNCKGTNKEIIPLSEIL